METKHTYNTIITVFLLALTGGSVLAQIHIPTDTSVGTWNLLSRTYTLTMDASAGIVVDEDSLTLNGAGHHITGAGAGDGITLVNRNGVVVTGATVEGFVRGIYLDSCSNCSISGNTLPENEEIGIFLLNSSGNSLTGNTVSGVQAYSPYPAGIFLRGSNDNVLTRNTVSNNRQGIHVLFSGYNTVTANTASDNSLDGLIIQGHPGYNLVSDNVSRSNNGAGLALSASSDNVVRGNIIVDNTWGIAITIADRIVVTENIVASSFVHGIDLGQGSYGGLIYNNNFINNNTVFGGPQAIADQYNRALFNLPLPDGGNFWDDWRTPDNNADGIVDLPYVFSGGQDNLPWADPVAWTAVAPTWPVGTHLTATQVTPGSLLLQWTPAEHQITVSEYKVYQDGVFIKSWPHTAYRVSGLAPDTEYTFKVKACELTHVCSSDGPSVVVQTLPSIAPTWPAGSAITASDIEFTSLRLTWDPAQHVVEVGEYVVYQDGVQVATVPGTTRSAQITGLEPATSYVFKIEACDGWGSCSTDGPEATIRSLTPQEAIQRMANKVTSLNFQQGIDNSLDAKLDAALNALDDINANNNVAAASSLRAFINAVEAQKGNMIAEADADELISDARAIIDVLGGL